MIQTKEIETNYAGSIANYESVRKQIAERWPGQEVAYNPKTNCATYRQWRENNFNIVPGETALHATVIITKKDKKTGDIIASYPKRVALFYHLQVRPMEPSPHS